MTANKLIKTDLSNATEQVFRIIVIKLITGLEKSIEHNRESIATDIRVLKNSHEELQNAINEVQDKMEMAIARIVEAEERIHEIERRIMEKWKLRKREIKKISRIKRGELVK